MAPEPSGSRVRTTRGGVGPPTSWTALLILNEPGLADRRLTSPRVKTAIFLSPLAPFSPGKKHWLTIEYQRNNTLTPKSPELGSDKLKKWGQNCR